MAANEPEPGKPGLTTVQSLSIASQFGLTLAVGVGVGLVAGQWLDGQLRTGLIFTLIGVFLGLAAAATGVVTLYRASLRKTESSAIPPSARTSANDDTDQ